MQPLRFPPRTVEKTQLWVLFCLLRQRCTEGSAGAVWAKCKSALIMINGTSVSAPAKNSPFHIHSPKESGGGTSLWDLSLNMIFPCVGKGNQSVLMGIEYLIVRQSGGEDLPRRFLKKSSAVFENVCILLQRGVKLHYSYWDINIYQCLWFKYKHRVHNCETI